MYNFLILIYVKIMSKCLCIIPARSGLKESKIKILLKLIINHLFITLLNLQKLKFVDEIIFSSD